MDPRFYAPMLRSDREAREREAWIEWHRRPDAEPLPPLPEPTPDLAKRLLSAIAGRWRRKTAMPDADAARSGATVVGRRV